MARVSPHSSLPYNYTRYYNYNEVQGTAVTRVRAYSKSKFPQSHNTASGHNNPPFPQELPRFAAGREGTRQSEKARVPEDGGLINQALIGLKNP